ncbi:NDR1/HIN1-like protein 3 [Prunus avium]|uniref:NDR1/HIN1-like protein 3 n=1 Tax=Prunus avium TaxID=42229 RepID=A0A6P5TTB5_PRUAV|nr:NDR1/HIN1-like protein 3 [Prunus avium]
MFATESSDIEKIDNPILVIIEMIVFFILFVMALVVIAGSCAYLVISLHSGYKIPEFSINGAYLNRFNYTETNHTLSYNLALNITLTNPNKKIHFNLSDTQVIAYYQNKKFGLMTLIDSRTTIHQDPKNTTIFQNALIQGWKPLLFEEPVLPNAAHLYSIDVVIAFQEKIGRMSGEVLCNLTVPQSLNGTSWDGFNTTKCSLSSEKSLMD